MFHKTSAVGEADYRLQSRGEMQMALQSVKPQLPRIALRGHKGGWYLLGMDIELQGRRDRWADRSQTPEASVCFLISTLTRSLLCQMDFVFISAGRCIT